ncbi:MAG: hypothetical protein NT138_08275 [Planctomycetales bacterium]|nr:hypothetical protein [Planctomycetales bacterium]
MNNNEQSADRTRHLITQLIDGELSAEEATELNLLAQVDAGRLEIIIDQLLIDSLLTEEVGAESLTALVDLVAEPQQLAEQSIVVSPASRVASPVRSSSRLWKPIGSVAAAVVLIAAAFLIGRFENSALADASNIVRAAAETHAAPIERVYLVEVDRSAASTDPRSGSVPQVNPRLSEITAPREVRVMTQGDQFYVEMNRGQRQWVWGRESGGGIWLTLGPRQAIVVEQDELGVPLEYIANLYTLNLETLLTNFLKHCRLKREDEGLSTYVITVTPRYRWRGGWVKSARIEVDRETKAVRRLVIERELPQQGLSTVTFSLIDSRPAEKLKYRPEGHLTEPFRLLTRTTQPDNRRTLMSNWFGPAADRWIKTPEANPQ